MYNFAYSLSENGHFKKIDDDNFSIAEGEMLWIDLDPKKIDDFNAVFALINVDPSIKEALLHNSQRPRLDVYDDHIYMSVRAVNLTNDDTPEDMVNLRAIIFSNILITFHTRELKSVLKLCDDVEKGQKFATVTALFTRLIKYTNDRISSEIVDISDNITELEEASLAGEISTRQEPLSELRRTLLGFQKYLIPQVAVLQDLYDSNAKWFKKKERFEMKNQAERIASLIGELEHQRQRATVLQEEIKSALSEQMNATMYRLTLVATILLPLSLFAGLMGANVGGMPYSDDPNGFWVLCGLSLLIGVGTYILMKILKWI